MCVRACVGGWVGGIFFLKRPGVDKTLVITNPCEFSALFFVFLVSSERGVLVCGK